MFDIANPNPIGRGEFSEGACYSANILSGWINLNLALTLTLDLGHKGPNKRGKGPNKQGKDPNKRAKGPNKRQKALTPYMGMSRDQNVFLAITRQGCVFTLRHVLSCGVIRNQRPKIHRFVHVLTLESNSRRNLKILILAE